MYSESNDPIVKHPQEESTSNVVTFYENYLNPNVNHNHNHNHNRNHNHNYNQNQNHNHNHNRNHVNNNENNDVEKNFYQDFRGDEILSIEDHVEEEGGSLYHRNVNSVNEQQKRQQNYYSQRELSENSMLQENRIRSKKKRTKNYDSNCGFGTTIVVFVIVALSCYWLVFYNLDVKITSQSGTKKYLNKPALNIDDLTLGKTPTYNLRNPFKPPSNKFNTQFKDDSFRFNTPYRKRTDDDDDDGDNAETKGLYKTNFFGDPKKEADHTLKSEKTQMSTITWKSMQTWFSGEISPPLIELQNVAEKAVKYENVLKIIVKSIIDKMTNPVNNYLVQIVVDLKEEDLQNTKKVNQEAIVEKIVDLTSTTKKYMTVVFGEFSLPKSSIGTSKFKDTKENYLEKMRINLYADALLNLMFSPGMDLKCCCESSDGRSECKEIEIKFNTEKEEEEEVEGGDNGSEFIELREVNHGNFKSIPLLHSCCMTKEIARKIEFDKEKERTSNLGSEHTLNLKLYENQRGFQNLKTNCSVVLMFNKLSYDDP